MRLIVVLLLGLAVVACAPVVAPTPTAAAVTAEPAPGVLRLTKAGGGAVDVRIEVAADDASRQRGLMFRESMAEDAGMLFVFQGDTDGPFWMKDTLIPLSIAFIGADRRIVSIKDMQPRSTELTQPGARYRYALEVNQGFFSRNGVQVGDAASWRGERDSNP
jgi:uncharacterized membrane protein (UPF0127 family)